MSEENTNNLLLLFCLLYIYNLRKGNLIIMKVFVFMLKQDDPFKCTAAKLVKFRLAQSVNYLPRKALVLNPFSPILLSKQDAKISDAICAIDCSWNRSEQELKTRFLPKHIMSRRLPAMLAANPINYSKLGRLSTVEALAGSLYILGDKYLAEALMEKFKWGHTFLELNSSLLEDYSNAENEQEILVIEKEYFPQPH
jgi:pre-rRNA-processing protein TSR3